MIHTYKLHKTCIIQHNLGNLSSLSTLQSGSSYLRKQIPELKTAETFSVHVAGLQIVPFPQTTHALGATSLQITFMATQNRVRKKLQYNLLVSKDLFDYLTELYVKKRDTKEHTLIQKRGGGLSL